MPLRALVYQNNHLFLVFPPSGDPPRPSPAAEGALHDLGTPESQVGRLINDVPRCLVGGNACLEEEKHGTDGSDKLPRYSGLIVGIDR